jgi:hypothetical protein
LRYQLQHYHLNVVSNPDLNNLSTMFELCEALQKIGNANTYYLIDRLISLILTLPVCIDIMKMIFRNKDNQDNMMENDFFTDN